MADRWNYERRDEEDEEDGEDEFTENVCSTETDVSTDAMLTFRSTIRLRKMRSFSLFRSPTLCCNLLQSPRIKRLTKILLL